MTAECLQSIRQCLEMRASCDSICRRCGLSKAWPAPTKTQANLAFVCIEPNAVFTTKFGQCWRACIGKNINFLKMSKGIPKIVRRFDFSLDNSGERTCLNCWFVKTVNFTRRFRYRESSWPRYYAVVLELGDIFQTRPQERAWLLQVTSDRHRAFGDGLIHLFRVVLAIERMYLQMIGSGQLNDVSLCKTSAEAEAIQPVKEKPRTAIISAYQSSCITII